MPRFKKCFPFLSCLTKPTKKHKSNPQDHHHLSPTTTIDNEIIELEKQISEAKSSLLEPFSPWLKVRVLLDDLDRSWLAMQKQK